MGKATIRLGFLLFFAAAAFVAAVSLGGMAVYSTQSSFCARCKIMQTRYVAWERSTHARSTHAMAACIDCHSEPGLLGEFRAHLNGARYVLVRLMGERRGAILRGKVYTKACMECHKVRDIIVRQPGHEINHSTHLNRRLECFQCHRNLSHGTLLGEPELHPMEVCASCHTQQQFQMRGCISCHSKQQINNLFLRARTLPQSM
jgi:nitrate/TMAO reductase-like tetraheme cytochrome c subunit